MFPNESGLCAQSLLIIMKSNAVNHNKLVGGEGRWSYVTGLWLLGLHVWKIIWIQGRLQLSLYLRMTRPSTFKDKKKIIFKSIMYSMKSMTKQRFEIHLPYPWRVSLPIGDENVFQPPHVMSIGNIIKSILITMMKILTMLEPTPLNIAQQIHMKLWDHHLNNASMSILWVMHKSNFEPL